MKNIDFFKIRIFGFFFFNSLWQVKNDKCQVYIGWDWKAPHAAAKAQATSTRTGRKAKRITQGAFCASSIVPKLLNLNGPVIHDRFAELSPDSSSYSTSLCISLRYFHSIRSFLFAHFSKPIVV